MKMTLIATGLGLAALFVRSPAQAAVTAEISFSENGTHLDAHVRVRGLEAGQAFRSTFRWTAPEVFYTTKKGEKIALFQSSEYTPEKPVGVAGVPWRCLCADTKEKGCWRTRAYRTIVTTLHDGSTRRGVGVWKLEFLDESGAVLGSGEHEVK
jgi:hypothetical protein